MQREAQGARGGCDGGGGGEVVVVSDGCGCSGHVGGRGGANCGGGHTVPRSRLTQLPGLYITDSTSATQLLTMSK